MNPEQLWDTTMDPEKRTLLQVTVESAEAAAVTFQNHMRSMLFFLGEACKGVALLSINNHRQLIASFSYKRMLTKEFLCVNHQHLHLS